MKHDTEGRVACETIVTNGVAVVGGEITTTAHVDYDELVRGTIRGVGYDRAKYGYDADTCAVMCTVKRQSPDIAMGVDTGGAGDQGLMFGFACDETDELMPMPIQLAHRLTQRLAEIRKANKVDFLRPDGKSQVTIEYRNGRPARVDCVVISTQHSEKVSNTHLRDAVSVMSESFGTAAIPEEKITALIREFFALTPKAIIEALDLRRPIYKATAAYGHFGRSGPGFTWECTDRADALRKAAGLGVAATAEVGARR